MAFVLILNTDVRPHGIGRQLSKTAKGVQGTTTLMTLQPGTNKVPVEDWKAAKEIKTVNHFLKDHACSGRNTLEEINTAESLSHLELADAINILPHTWDRALLSEWAKEDGRREIQAAINKQFEILDAAETQGDQQGGKGKAPAGKPNNLRDRVNLSTPT